MASRYKKYMMAVMLCELIVTTVMHACMVTFINDGQSKVAIFNEADETFTLLARHSKRRFGRQDQKTKFKVYIPHAPRVATVFVPAYTCVQKSCSSDGQTIVKFSDLEDARALNNIFIVKKHEPHFSMVQKLPTIQKEVCGACQSE